MKKEETSKLAVDDLADVRSSASIAPELAAKKAEAICDHFERMLKMVYAKVEGLRKRVDALEKAQAQAPRLVSLKPTEKGGHK